MREVLLDSRAEADFNRDGYVTIPLLSSEELNGLKDLIARLNKGKIEDSVEENSTYKLSFFNTDLDFKQLVFRELTAFFQPKIDKFLKSYKPLIINIFDKEPGMGEVPVHQNWTFVDEDKYTSVSVWIPLVDVSRANGTLEVVKGSHKVLCKYRSPSLPWVFDELNDVLKEKYLVPFEFSAGNAAVIDDGILHWSSENNTDIVRTAVQLIMVPDDAVPIHYHRKPGNDVVDVYRVDPLFFMQFNMRDIPDGYQVIGHEKIDLKKFTEEEFRNIVAVNDPGIRMVPVGS